SDSDSIGVQSGTTGQFYVEGSDDLDFPGLPATCVTYRNGSLAVQDLVNGNLKYVIIDAAPAASITEAINAMRKNWYEWKSEDADSKACPHFYRVTMVRNWVIFDR